MDETWFAELSEFLRIPSVSADPAHREDVKRAGEWAAEFIRSKLGGTAQLTPFGEKELVLGEVRASHDADNAPTVLVYNHFDVQPPAPLDLWESDPFELTIKDEWALPTSSDPASRPSRERSSTQTQTRTSSALRRSRRWLQVRVIGPARS